MARIVGVNIPDKKRAEIALTYIYGIGPSRAKFVLGQARVDVNKRAAQLTSDEINRIKEVIEKNYKIEGDLKRDVMFHIKRLKDIKSYRGIRHMKGLPVRGQRTKTNSRTRRGNVRKTAGSGRRALDKK
ncbi:30S ribosomal protein S13 [Candidatus Azambacteria bacterium]|nr:30S ribosomal protein S13 [Candidatus Azambacteria bacterium]MBI3684804.1 30S ribosomal protein S13 [Candidatus Azambacteria bacterium]